MEEPRPIAVDDAIATRLEMGKRIRLRRQQVGLSVVELAERLGVSRESVYGYESGSRAINSYDLPRLGEIMRVPVSYFFGEFMPHGTVSNGAGTWIPSGKYLSTAMFPSREDLIVLSEAEMEVLGTMRGLTPEGQEYIRAFTQMVREREADTPERKTNPEPGGPGGEIPPGGPEDNAPK